MFLSREIDIKLCQNYTKTGISQILYKTNTYIQQLRNQSENDYISKLAENLRFAPFIII